MSPQFGIARSNMRGDGSERGGVTGRISVAGDGIVTLGMFREQVDCSPINAKS
jgi:hypothetical protein